MIWTGHMGNRSDLAFLRRTWQASLTLHSGNTYDAYPRMYKKSCFFSTKRFLAALGSHLTCQATKMLQGTAERLESIESDVKNVMAVAGERLRGMTATGFTLGVLLNGFTLLLAVSCWG
jgi:hypothetical protein